MNKARTILTAFAALVRLHWIGLCIAVGVMLLYTLAGFFLVPYVARSQLNSFVTEELHRKISVGEIRFNPFLFDASVTGFRLSEANDEPLIEFRNLYVNAQLASLWQLAVVLKEVQVAAPSVRLIIEKDGSVNLARLIPASEAPPEEKAAPPRVRIGTLEVIAGRAVLADYTHAEPFTAAIAPIKFTLNDFRTDAGYQNDYNFAGTTLAGEALAWSGAFTVQPLGSTGQFRVEGLKAATIDSYLHESLPFSLASGNATLNGNYRFELEPFALDVSLPSVAVRDLKLAERANTASVPIAVPELEMQDIAFSYAKRDVGMKLIELRKAHVDVAREKDGSISLSRLMNGGDEGDKDQGTGDGKQTEAGGNASQSDSPPATERPSGRPSPSSWNLHADTIRLDQASIIAEDRSVTPAAKLELTPLNLTLSDWSTDPAAKLQIDADVTINKDGKLLSKGELQLEPLSAQLAVNLTGFSLPVIQPYLEEATAMTLHSGSLSVKGDVSYAATPQNAPPLKFTGEVQVADLRTTDQFVNEDFVKWRNLAVTGISFRSNPDRLTIDRIVARQPYAKVVIAEDTSMNVTRVLNRNGGNEEGSNDPGAGDRKDDVNSERPRETRGRGTSSRSGTADSGKQASGRQPVADGQSAAFPIRIKTVQFIDGSANFADYSIEPSFASGILGLNGTVTGLSSDPASRAKVKLDGKVDKYAPVDISGEVNLLSAAKYTDLSMNFRNMELTTFNPYSGKFAGYNISKGKLSTELKYQVEDRKLDAAHHIVIDNLEFGAKTDSKDAAPIPLKLAVALLKDRQGIIDINLPVSGSLDDPKFRLGPIIWKAVLGLLTKIVTAPFAALGALFGGGEELAYVDFPAGSAALAASETEKLNKLARALIERPQLKLSLPLTVVTAQDGDALARAALAARLPPEAAQPPSEDGGAKRKRVAVLEKVYKGLFKASPEYPPETPMEKDADQKNSAPENASMDAQLQFLEQALLEKLQPDAAALNALAQQRARAAQDALLANTELNPERVFITGERTEGKPEDGKVRMEMKLE